MEPSQDVPCPEERSGSPKEGKLPARSGAGCWELNQTFSMKIFLIKIINLLTQQLFCVALLLWNYRRHPEVHIEAESAVLFKETENIGCDSHKIGTYFLGFCSSWQEVTLSDFTKCNRPTIIWKCFFHSFIATRWLVGKKEYPQCTNLRHTTLVLNPWLWREFWAGRWM